MAEQRASDEEISGLCERSEQFDEDTLAGLLGHRCALDLRDARAEAASTAAEIDRLKEERDEARTNVERFRNSMYAVEEQSLRNLQRAEAAESRLTAMATVTEADVDAAKEAYARHASLPQYVGDGAIRAALEAFVALKRAAPDHPADAKAPGADEQLEGGDATSHCQKNIAPCPTNASNPAPQSDQACGAAVRVLVSDAMVRAARKADYEESAQGDYDTPEEERWRFILETAIGSDPAVIAALSGDPWCYDLEKAPRDGTRMLLFFQKWSNGDPVRLGAYDESVDCWRTTSGPHEFSPDAWMLVPAAPAPRKQEAGR